MENQCVDCGKTIKNTSIRCRKCNGIKYSHYLEENRNTPEVISKISKALKGRKKSPEHISNMKKSSLKREETYRELMEKGTTPRDGRKRNPVGHRRTAKNGYVLIKVYIGKDYANYIPEHRYVVEQSIGRKLKKSEHIHHIDGDKSNNDLSNLLLLTSYQHAKLNHFIGLLNELSSVEKIEIFKTLKLRYSEYF